MLSIGSGGGTTDRNRALGHHDTIHQQLTLAREASSGTFVCDS